MVRLGPEGKAAVRGGGRLAALFFGENFVLDDDEEEEEETGDVNNRRKTVRMKRETPRREDVWGVTLTGGG